LCFIYSIALDPSRTSAFSKHQPEYLHADDAEVVITLHTDELFGMYSDIGNPENNIYVNAGPAYEACNSDHVCQHTAVKGSISEALGNPGPLNKPATYEQLTKPLRTKNNNKLRFSSDAKLGILKLGPVDSNENDDKSKFALIAVLTLVILFGIFGYLYFVYGFRRLSEVPTIKLMIAK